MAGADAVTANIRQAYCRVAYLDVRRRYLGGDAEIAASYGSWDADQVGYLDPATGVLVLNIERRDPFGQRPMTGAAYLVAHYCDAVLTRRMAEIGRSYTLSPRQTVFLAALVRTGGVQEAARASGLAYAAGRNMLADIKTKTGFATLAPMIGHMLELVAGPSKLAGDPIDQHDVFGLSERQFAIACRISTTANRRELAQELGISEAVLKVELKNIFLILGVQTASQLARVVVEARLSLASAGLHTDASSPAHTLPETRIQDDDGRTIAWSDFGPASARPVFILHSTITTRAPPTRLVSALQKAGFRPLALDRPGFGETSPAPADHDHHDVAVRDFRHVCDALGLTAVDIIARGSGHAAMIIGQEAPERIARAVLVNPTPHIDFTSIDAGPLGAVKRRIVKSPIVTEGMIRLLAAFNTPQRMRDGMLRSFRGSAPDTAIIDDPRFVADYLRATRHFGEGHVAGYVAEQTIWGRGLEVRPLPGRTQWRILQGAHFVLHAPTEALVYWRRLLPDTPVTVIEEAGQMLAYSHPEHVVSALLA